MREIVGKHSGNEDFAKSEDIRSTAYDVKVHLESVRRLLVESPGTFSVTAAGAALDRVTEGLLALNEALRRDELVPDLRHEVTQVLTMSGRVNALYRQAANFYGGLAAESVKNGAWDAASYSADGDWKSAAPAPGSRLKVEG